MSTREAVLQARQERIDELHRLEQGRTALLVIDMQRGFLDPGAALEVPPGRAIIPNLRLLLDVCRRRQLPVIFTEFVYSSAVPCLRGDPFGRYVDRTHLGAELPAHALPNWSKPSPPGARSDHLALPVGVE